MERRIVAQLFDSIDYISAVGNVANSTSTVSSAEASTDNSNSITKTDAASIAEAVVSNLNGDTAMEVEVKDEGPAKPKLVVLIAATNKYVLF